MFSICSTCELGRCPVGVERDGIPFSVGRGRRIVPERTRWRRFAAIVDDIDD